MKKTKPPNPAQLSTAFHQMRDSLRKQFGDAVFSEQVEKFRPIWEQLQVTNPKVPHLKLIQELISQSDGLDNKTAEDIRFTKMAVAGFAIEILFPSIPAENKFRVTPAPSLTDEEVEAMVRSAAPRTVHHVDVADMSKEDAEAHIQKTADAFRNRVVTDEYMLPKE